MPAVLKVPRGSVVRYGKIFPPKPDGSPYNLLEVELACFLMGGTRTTDKYFHCERAVRLLWPRMEYHEWLREVLEECCRTRFTGLTGSANSTKSWGMAVYCLVDWYADPIGTLSFVISTSKVDARQRVWGHIQQLHGMVEYPMPGRLMRPPNDSIALRDMPKGEEGTDQSQITLLAAGTSDAVKRLQGKKNGRVRVYCDEGQDVDSALGKAIWNLNENADFQARVSGNPSQTFDFHGKFCEPVAELGGHALDYEDLRTWPILAMGMYPGTVLHLNNIWSPNFEREEMGLPLIPYLPRPEQVLQVRRTLSREDPVLWRQHIGVWPKGIGIKQTVFTDAETVQYGIREKVELTGVRYGMSIDPAWVEDGDDYIITVFQIGSSAKSGGVFQLVTQIPLREEPYTDQATGIVYTATRSKAKRTVAIARQYGITAQYTGMDATGAIAYADMLDEEFALVEQHRAFGILRVNFGESAGSELAVSLSDERVGKDVYVNKAAELWRRLHAFAEHGQLKGVDDPQLLKELTMRKFTIKARGREAIESKKDFKKRTGGKSPDRVDSLAVGLDVACERMGAIAGQQVIETRQAQWNQQAERMRVPVARLQGTGGLGRMMR